MAGLAFFGFSLGLVVRADLGLAPWDVFHQGVSQQIGWSLGAVIVATSFVVVLLWIPIRERPGIGTLANAVLVGVWVDLSLWVLPEDLSSMTVRVGFLVVGIGVNGVATGFYIGARFGSGPRDGLMTGLAARGYSVRVVRTIIEAIVLSSGFLLGGSIGIGTVLFAVAIGPIAHQAIPFFTKFTAPADTQVAMQADA
jgi:uncharacterized membrane protein YczE